MDKKTIVVTGGAGFVGSHLCERLAKEGHRVISLDNYFTGSRENHVDGVEYREGHTKDIEILVPEYPDLVYHLGEYARVEKSFEDIELVFDLNKIGTFAVLEFVRRRGSKIVYAGSSTKFGDDGLGRDQSPYAWTKATNTELVNNYSQWFKIPFAITYFYNVYGPGERAGAFGTLIEIFRQNKLSGKPLTVVSPGTQTRCFTHVEDIVDGLILVGEKGEGDNYGLGDNRPYSILEVARLFDGEIVMLPERQGNRMFSDVITEKSETLGWKAQRHLEEYVRLVIEGQVIQKSKEKKILVFTTTFLPHMGPAEQAFLALIERTPSIHFDIITSRYTKNFKEPVPLPQNISVHYVGHGTIFDKYLLPVYGAKLGRSLVKKNDYLFSWSIVASYGALAALFVRQISTTPLLVTLADQPLHWYAKLFLRFVLGRADQVYTSTDGQIDQLRSLKSRMQMRASLGEGDSFANQMRFSYALILKNIKK